jgi:hypothetical protein
MYTASACASTTVSTVGRADWETHEHHGCDPGAGCIGRRTAGQRNLQAAEKSGEVDVDCQLDAKLGLPDACAATPTGRLSARAHKGPRNFSCSSQVQANATLARGVTHSPGAPQNSVTSPTATPPPSMVSMSEQKVMTCLTTSCAFSRNKTGRGRRVRQPRAATMAICAAMLCQLARSGSARAAPAGKGALRTCRSSSADFPPLCAGLASLRTALSTSTASCFEICASVAPETPHHASSAHRCQRA